MEIRSYRAVFDLERRIYRIDRLRLNPSGVPVRGVIYGLALIALVLVCGQVPPLSIAIKALPWYVVDLGLPAGAAALLTVVRIDGRPAHLAAQALLYYRLGSRRSVGLRPARAASSHQAGADPGARWWPREILLLPDGSDACIRRLRYNGPGAVLVGVAHERIEPSRLSVGRPELKVRELSGRGLSGRGPSGRGPSDPARSGQVIALARGATLRTG
jgi:hypothetical protein